MKAKEAMVQRLVFLKLPTYLIKHLVIFFESAPVNITKEVVGQIFMTQAATKVPAQIWLISRYYKKYKFETKVGSPIWFSILSD